MLIHLIDATCEDPALAWSTIRGELAAYGGGLEEKAELIALNKIDALSEEERAEAAAAIEEVAGSRPFLISGVSGEGVRELLRAAHAKVRERDAPVAEPSDSGTWRP